MKYVEIEYGQIADFYDLEGYFNRAEDQDIVRVYDGDTEVDSVDLLAGFSVLVLGNLIVNENITGMDDEGGFLFVAGNFQAKNVLVGGPEIWVKGDLNVTNGLLADYNHGCLTVEGDLNARIVLAEHSVRVGGAVNAISVDFGGLEVKDEEFKPTVGYYDVVDSIFVDEVLAGGVLGLGLFRALEAGKPVLK